MSNDCFQAANQLFCHEKPLADDSHCKTVARYCTRKLSRAAPPEFRVRTNGFCPQSKFKVCIQHVARTVRDKSRTTFEGSSNTKERVCGTNVRSSNESPGFELKILNGRWCRRLAWNCSIPNETRDVYDDNNNNNINNNSNSVSVIAMRFNDSLARAKRKSTQVSVRTVSVGANIKYLILSNGNT